MILSLMKSIDMEKMMELWLINADTFLRMDKWHACMTAGFFSGKPKAKKRDQNRRLTIERHPSGCCLLCCLIAWPEAGVPAKLGLSAWLVAGVLI